MFNNAIPVVLIYIILLYIRHPGVRVNGPKDKFRVDMWKGAERTVNCRYNPEVPGKYTINIKWEDQHVKVYGVAWGAFRELIYKKYLPFLP